LIREETKAGKKILIVIKERKALIGTLRQDENVQDAARA